jgi:hypothetical protein
MPVYRLDPIQPLDPRWSSLSSICECLWTSAATDLEARHYVAHKTAVTHQRAADRTTIDTSPWLSDLLSTCVAERDDMEVPRGMVIKADGEAL